MTPKRYFAKIADTVFKHLIPRLKARGEELFPILDQPEHKPHHSRIHRALEWLSVPPTEWIMDYIGGAKRFAGNLKEGKPIDPRMLQLMDELEEPPGDEQQERAIELERVLQRGDYAAHLSNSSKYEAMEQQIKDNPNRIAHWNRIKEMFNVNKFRHRVGGVIRRTQYLERGMPPEEFYLEDDSNEERWIFQALFDHYCKKYCLFGMRFDEPLVERLNVTRNQFTTTISIPRWLKVARDDIRWDIVQETHGNDNLAKQGVKASGNEVERIEMLRRIDQATIQAKAAGYKGERLRREIEKIAKLPYTDKRTHIRWQNEIKELKKKGIL